MFKYRKKPVVIEAFQLTEETRNNNYNWPQWAHKAWNEEILKPDPEGAGLLVATLENPMKAEIGCWIIQGVQGELYPCKDEIFQATYVKE